MKIFILTLIAILCLFTHPVTHAQVYSPVTHLSGTQNISGINVTVTNTNASNINFCGEGPYWIGSAGNSDYTFTFSSPVGGVKMRFTAMNVGEVISFTVNGVAHVLTTSELTFFTGTCNQAQAIVDAGNLTVPATVPNSPGGGGEVKIAGNITSMKVSTNGVQAGSVFSLSFGGVSASSNAPICQKDTLRLFVQPGIPGATYSWTGPSGFNSTLQNPVIPNAGTNNEGTYHVTMTAPSGDILSDSTVVILSPSAVAHITFNDPVCAGSDLLLSATSSTLTGVSYQWTGPNGFGSTISNPTVASVHDVNSGMYAVTTSLGGCTYKDSLFIKVLPPVTDSFSKAVCANEKYYFNNTLLKIPGIYKHAFTAANGCDSVVTVNFSVLPAPDVQLLSDARESMCLGDSLNLNAKGAMGYSWNINGKGIPDSSEHIVIKLPKLSNLVSLVGLDHNGCSDTVLSVVAVEGCCMMFLPNAFTPNGDGKNDSYGARTNGHFAQFQMSIFNRWGQRVFTGNNQNQFWDGTVNGSPADAGSYFYHVKATCLENTELERKGDISLIR